MSTNNRDQLVTTIEIPSSKANLSLPYRAKMRSNLSAEDNAQRAPPLDIKENSEVTVINGDRSNLTWKRYNLIEINHRNGMCLVEGMADSRQRNFPRSVVKPKVNSNIVYHIITINININTQIRVIIQCKDLYLFIYLHIYIGMDRFIQVIISCNGCRTW